MNFSMKSLLNIYLESATSRLGLCQMSRGIEELKYVMCELINMFTNFYISLALCNSAQHNFTKAVKVVAWRKHDCAVAKKKRFECGDIALTRSGSRHFY